MARSCACALSLLDLSLLATPPRLGRSRAELGIENGKPRSCTSVYLEYVPTPRKGWPSSPDLNVFRVDFCELAARDDLPPLASCTDQLIVGCL